MRLLDKTAIVTGAGARRASCPSAFAEVFATDCEGRGKGCRFMEIIRRGRRDRGACTPDRRNAFRRCAFATLAEQW